MTLVQTPTEARHGNGRHVGRHKGVEAEGNAASAGWTGLDALITRTIAMASQDNMTLALAAEAVARLRWPDADEDSHKLHARGLASFAYQRQGEHNRYVPDEKDSQAVLLGRFQRRTDHSPERLADVMERVTMAGYDGVPRLLIDFGMEDVKANRADADGQVVGWQRRVSFWSLYEAMLGKHKAETGRALPTTALERLRREARECWG